jgi:hypothetical protein
MALLPYQQRVVDEKSDLDEKRGALDMFFGSPVFAGIDHEEQLRMRHQAVHMHIYSTILGDRIAAFV